MAVQSFNTPRGTILVSSVEATAVDLVGYEQRAGVRLDLGVEAERNAADTGHGIGLDLRIRW